MTKSKPRENKDKILNSNVSNLKTALDYYQNIITLRSQKKIPLAISLTFAIVEFYVKKDQIIRTEKNIEKITETQAATAKICLNDAFRT
jgi:hypothetical protein